VPYLSRGLADLPFPPGRGVRGAGGAEYHAQGP
jgi:hypothetical protein